MSHFFKDLLVRQEAKALAVEIYRVSEKFPKRESSGLTCQLQRATVSVPSNIAEGQGRLTKGEFLNFLSHARGSLLELITQIEIAEELKYIDANIVKSIEMKAFNVLRLLNALIDSLRDQARGASD
jgi:four helix bundle protein